MTLPGSPAYSMPRDIATLARAVTDAQRSLLELRAATTGGGSTVVIGSSGQWLTPEQFLAAGDGVTDDTAALQEMVNTALPGQTMVGSAGKTYLINGTVNFPNDNVTFDGRGCAVQAGNARTDTNAAEDRYFSVVSGVGVRILNTRFLAGQSAPGVPTFGGKVYLAMSASCVVDGCTLDGEDVNGYTLALYACDNCAVTGCTVTAGAFGGWSNKDCEFVGNWSDRAPADGLAGVGWTGAPSARNLYERNLVTSRAGVGIAEVCGDPGMSFGHTFRDNIILTPALGSAQVGISALGPRNRFGGNYVLDPVLAGIDTSAYGTVVEGNTVQFTNQGHAASTGITLTGSSGAAGGDTGATVTGNRVHRATVGIQLVAPDPAAPLAAVTITGNTVTDPISYAIDCAAANLADGPTLTANRVRYTEPGVVATRVGIRTAAGATVVGNTVAYASVSYSGTGVARPTLDLIGLYGDDSPNLMTVTPGSLNKDQPFVFAGDNVTFVGNKVDDGGRVDSSLLPSAGSGNGWTFQGNAWGHGGVDKTGIGGTLFDLDARAVLPASSAAGATLRVPHGAAPSAPVNGDMWTTTAGLFVRVNGATVGPLT